MSVSFLALRDFAAPLPNFQTQRSSSSFILWLNKQC